MASSDPVTDSSGTITGPPILLRTTDGLTWTQGNTSQPLANTQKISSIAIAASSSFNTWYLGLENPLDIWRTDNGGGMWTTGATGITSGRVNDVEVDRATALHAYAAVGGGTAPGVYQTVNGIDWTQLTGSGATAWPTGVSATALAIDPADASIVYAATAGGMLRGSGAGLATTVQWTPYDEGLPNGVTAPDLWVNPDTGALSTATGGYGAFQRATSADAMCRERMLHVRDNVQDVGVGVTVNSLPDPEHPIPDPARPGFFKPDDTSAGRLYWWQSTDIRVDVPSLAAVPNQIPAADHVEAETCPVEMSSCPAGTIRDIDPVRGVAARVYAQVNNPGVDPLRDTKMIALYADATSGLPDLPSNFWTTTFPAGSAPCGALTPGTGWSLVDSSNPCRTIPATNPLVPETRSFDWSVPATQATHTCFLVIADSPDDPIPSAVRTTNETRVWKLVPENRQIGNRNLHVVDLPTPCSGSREVPGGGGRPRSVDEAPSLSISGAGLPEGTRLGLLLPQGRSVDGLRREPATLDQETQQRAAGLGLDTSTLWVVDGLEATITNLFASRGEQVPFMVVWSGLSAPPGSTWRITTGAHRGGVA